MYCTSKLKVFCCILLGREKVVISKPLCPNKKLYITICFKYYKRLEFKLSFFKFLQN